MRATSFRLAGVSSAKRIRSGRPNGGAPARFEEVEVRLFLALCRARVARDIFVEADIVAALAGGAEDGYRETFKRDRVIDDRVNVRVGLRRRAEHRNLRSQSGGSHGGAGSRQVSRNR